MFSAKEARAEFDYRKAKKLAELESERSLQIEAWLDTVRSHEIYISQTQEGCQTDMESLKLHMRERMNSGEGDKYVIYHVTQVVKPDSYLKDADMDTPVNVASVVARVLMMEQELTKLGYSVVVGQSSRRNPYRPHMSTTAEGIRHTSTMMTVYF